MKAEAAWPKIDLRRHGILKTFCVFLLACISCFADNAIQIENAKPGASDWTLSNPATNREIEGYASLTSVNIGGRIKFFVSTGDQTFNLQILRSGWYGGLGARLMSSVGLPGSLQATPSPDPVTGLTECNWTSAYTLTVPTTWTSGIYLARLTGNTSGKQSYIIFVVRDDGRPSDLVFESSVTTFQAYNFWPGGSNGKSLYSWAPGGRGWKVSFNRPYVLGYSYTANSPGAASGVGAGEYLANLQPGPNTGGYPIPPAGFEYNMVRWLEANGYDVTYMTDVDMHENASLLLNHKAFLSVGHNEYWSMPMVQNLQGAINSGVSAGFFSANTMYWQIRFEPDALGNNSRTMVCYKTDAVADDPMYSVNPQLTTTTFRSAPVNMPEAGLVGVEYVGDPVNGDIVVTNASHWLMNGTGLNNDDHLTGLLGYEVDSYVPGISPANTVVLASSPIGLPADVNNPPGFACQSTECNSNMTWYSTGRSSVFATGSMYWSWGLDDFNAPALRPSYLNPKAQQLTRNVLAALIDPVVITTSSLPIAVAGVSYTPFQLTAAGGSAPYIWSSSNLPSGMALSSWGSLSGIPPSAGTIAVTVTVNDSNGNSASSLLNFVVQSQTGSNGGGTTLASSTMTLPFGSTGAPYAQSLLATGGAPPYQWSVVNGALPLGLTLSAAGQLTGTPQTTGVSQFTAQVIDATAQQATSALQVVAIGTVDDFLANSINSGRWCQCVLDQAPGSQNGQLSISQGNGQLSIFPQSGLSGMNYSGYGALSALNMTDAALSVEAVGAAAGGAYTDTSFALAVDAKNWYRFIVESGSLYLQSMVGGVKSGVAIPYDKVAHRYWRFRHNSAAGQMLFETSATGASWTLDWQTSTAVPVNALFAGLNAGTWNSDQITGPAVFANLRWEQNVDPPLPYIALLPPASGTVGVAYASSLTGIAGTSPFQWSLVSSSLPAGLGIDSSGNLSGVPSAAGTYRFTVQLRDAASLTANEVFQINIAAAAPMAISTVTLPNGIVNTGYAQVLTSTGGTPPYQWSLLSGTLPAGLTISGSGQITGTPTSAGTSSFIVQVRDANSLVANQSLQLIVAAQTYTITGTVTRSGSGLAGAVVSLNGKSTATTSNTGTYSLSGLVSGAYTVSVTLPGFTFSPPSQTLTNITANNTANFTASPITITPRAISINFVGAGTPIGATETAGVISKPHWNNAVSNQSASALKLIDDTNAASPATVTWAADNVWSTPIVDTAGNARMMKGYLDTAHGNPVTVTVSALPVSATGYDVYVYFDADNGSGTKTMTFSLAAAGVTNSTVVGIDSATQNLTEPSI